GGGLVANLPRLGGAFAAGLADQRLAFADQRQVAAGGADVGAATGWAEARGAGLGDRQEDQVVGRRAAREAARDEPRGRLRRGFLALAAAQPIGVEALRVDVGEVVTAQVADPQLAEHVVED